MNNLEPWQIFLGIGGALAAVSVPMYLFQPTGTSQHFHPRREPIPHDHAWWVQSVSAGDALIAFVCLHGVRARGTDVLTRHFCLSSLVIYNSLHMLAFWDWRVSDRVMEVRCTLRFFRWYLDCCLAFLVLSSV